MSRKILERAVNFINDITKEINYSKCVIGTFDKYTVYILANDEPRFYIEYQAENEFNDVLYRFSLLNATFDGIGEFKDWDALDIFLKEYWSKIIMKYNLINNAAIENKGYIKYN